MAKHKQSDLRQLHEKLHSIARPECLSCGANDWMDTTRLPVVIQSVNKDSTVTPGHGIDAIVAICAACGYVRLHSAQVLRGLQG